jgi:hypothetical protein
MARLSLPSVLLLGVDHTLGFQGSGPIRGCFINTLSSAPTTQLMLSHPAESYIERSKWSSRGWTFQERLLAQRCLIFTAGRVFLQCRGTTFCEDIVESPRGWSIELLNSPMRINDNNSIRQYVTFVRLYTPRRLTYANDVLNAFEGVQGILSSPLKANFFHGLPDSIFDLALL